MFLCLFTLWGTTLFWMVYLVFEFDLNFKVEGWKDWKQYKTARVDDNKEVLEEFCQRYHNFNHEPFSCQKSEFILKRKKPSFSNRQNSLFLPRFFANIFFWGSESFTEKHEHEKQLSFLTSTKFSLRIS